MVNMNKRRHSYNNERVKITVEKRDMELLGLKVWSFLFYCCDENDCKPSTTALYILKVTKSHKIIFIHQEMHLSRRVISYVQPWRDKKIWLTTLYIQIKKSVFQPSLVYNVWVSSWL